MATTTNYSWSTPDDTALVKDGAAAIRTLGSSIDTTTKALNPSTTLGDIEYRSATANTNTRLPIGTTGQVLAVSGGVPAWTTPAAGPSGKLLQLVRATTSTKVDSSSTTYADTTLTATITPTSSTSKIFVLVHQNGLRRTNAGYSNGVKLRLLRGATSIYLQDGEGMINSASTLITLSGYSHAFSYLDAPATTSAVTYKTQFSSATGDPVTVQQGDFLSDIVLMEIGA